MDDHIRKLNIRISNKEAELNALYTEIQKLERDIATLQHKKDKKSGCEKTENSRMSLNGVRKVIFETEEEEKEKD